jgi:hypothetical protein
MISATWRRTPFSWPDLFRSLGGTHHRVDSPLPACTRPCRMSATGEGVRLAHRHLVPDVVILDDGSTREGVRRSLDRVSKSRSPGWPLRQRSRRRGSTVGGGPGQNALEPRRERGRCAAPPRGGVGWHACEPVPPAGSRRGDCSPPGSSGHGRGRTGGPFWPQRCTWCGKRRSVSA